MKQWHPLHRWVCPLKLAKRSSAESLCSGFADNCYNLESVVFKNAEKYNFSHRAKALLVHYFLSLYQH